MAGGAQESSCGSEGHARLVLLQMREIGILAVVVFGSLSLT